MSAIFTAWSSISSWFTPTVLFCFLNLTIATIYLSSNFKSRQKTHNHSDDDPYYPTRLTRAPSILDRVRSINHFSLHRSDSLDPPQPETHRPDPPQSRLARAPSILNYFSLYPSQPETHQDDPVQNQLARAPSILERVRSFNYFSDSPDPVQTHQPDPVQARLTRAPSILQRVRSFNYFSPNPSDSSDPSQPEQVQTHQPEPVQPWLTRAPSLLERVKSFNFSLYGYDHPDPNHHSKTGQDPSYDEHHVIRSKSATTTTGGEAAEGHVRMRKSASERWREAEAEAEEEELRRPATVREGKGTTAAGFFGEEEEGEVDAKADDFINRFKQQLKLQRLDSLLQYREMLTRGASR